MSSQEPAELAGRVQGQVGKPRVIPFLSLPRKGPPRTSWCWSRRDIHLSTWQNTLVFSNPCYLAMQPEEGRPGFGPITSTCRQWPSSTHLWLLLREFHVVKNPKHDSEQVLPPVFCKGVAIALHDLKHDGESSGGKVKESRWGKHQNQDGGGNEARDKKLTYFNDVKVQLPWGPVTWCAHLTCIC